MAQLWDQLEGESLAGNYGLEQWLGSDPSGAFYQTTHGPEKQSAVLKLVAEDPSTAEEQLALWRITGRLSHPHLLALLDCGRADVGGGAFLYAVFERPDDRLAGAVENGPLSGEETSDVLVAALDALRYIHSQGMVHASIDAEHIVAVGDRIKVASDTLRYSGDGEADRSEDVRALGALIYELLTAQRPEPGQAPDVSAIADPLRTVIRHALEEDPRSRWTAEQIAEALNPARPGDLSAAIKPVEAATEVKRSPVLETRASPAPPVLSPPVWPPAPARQRVESESPQGRAPRPIAKYVPMAAVVAMTLLAFIFVLTHRSAPTPPAVAIVPPSVGEAARAIPDAPKEPPPGSISTSPARQPQARAISTSPAKQPLTRAVSTSPIKKPVETLARARSPLQTWRVIAYTYSRYEDAEKKVKDINKRFAGFHAEVFTVGRDPASYLVSLGAHMTREEAAVLQQRALGKGLPRDTYIQNFSD